MDWTIANFDEKDLFFDERLRQCACAHCGSNTASLDHVPSRILLDDPLPPNAPKVHSCIPCNASFSRDEEYVACLIECLVTGAKTLHSLTRSKIKKTLNARPALWTRIQLELDPKAQDWQADFARVRRVLLKNARGHAAYELGIPQLEEPVSFWFRPLLTLDDASRRTFEGLDTDQNIAAVWPEIGTRAFLRAATTWSPTGSLEHDQWLLVQEGRYRYGVVEEPDGLIVRGVLSEYLAFESIWVYA